jgi:vacuolar protein sorting-associated protein 13D
MNFLRMEIVLQGATYYMLFGNAEVLPPPIRLDNFSEVPIQFYQPATKHELKTVVRPHASMSYVLDEPMGLQCLQVEAPGGDNFNCVLGGFEDVRLTYENFIYIAFSHTFERCVCFFSGPFFVQNKYY